MTVKNKSKLVPVQKLVTRNGKTFLQTFLVSPEQAQKEGHHINPDGVTFKEVEHFKDFTKTLTTEQRQEVMKIAKEHGITWNGAGKIEWMRCAMAVQSHIKSGHGFKIKELMSDLVEVKAPTQPKPDSVKPQTSTTSVGGQTFTSRDDFKNFTKKLTTEQRQEIMKDAEKQGVQWTKGGKTEWMLCAMAIGKKLDNGETYTIGSSDVPKPNPTPVVPTKTPKPEYKMEKYKDALGYNRYRHFLDGKEVKEGDTVTVKIMNQYRTAVEKTVTGKIIYSNSTQVRLNDKEHTQVTYGDIIEHNPAQTSPEPKPEPVKQPDPTPTPQPEAPKSDKPKIHQFFDGIGAPAREDNGNLVIGNGYKAVKNKWGKDDTAPNHIRMVLITKKPKMGDGNWIKLDSAFLDKDRLKNELGAKWDMDEKKWYIPFTSFAKTFGVIKNVEIHSQLAPTIKAVFENPKVDVQSAIATAKGAKSTAPIRNNQDIDISNFKNPSGMRNPWGAGELNLYDHQKKGVQFLLNNKRATAGLAVGLGKTLTSITALKQLIDDKKVKRAVVISPSSVKFNWKQEVEMYSDMKVCVLESGDLNNPNKALKKWKEAEDAQVIIVNYEMLRKDEYREKLQKLAPNCVIADEAHKLKNGQTQQTKGFRDTWKNAEYKWFLSATPYPNGQPKETYTMLAHLRPDKVGTWANFSREHVVFEGSGQWAKAVALKNVDKLKQKMSDVVFIRTHNSPDVTSSLPKERHTTINLEMNKEQEKLYKAIKEDIASELKALERAGLKASAPMLLAKMKRLEQVAIDPDMLQEDSTKIDMNKLYPKEQYAVDTMVDHLSDPDNRGFVVFCDMKLPLDKVRQGLINNGVDPKQIGYITGDVKPEERTKIQEKMKTGEVKVVFCTNAGEEGVNLQHGAHTLMHLDVPWVPKSITQREGRVLRQGQPSSFTQFYSPIVKGTVEDVKRNKLGMKVGAIEGLLGAGSAGSSAGNVAADTGKPLTIDDIKAILGV